MNIAFFRLLPTVFTLIYGVNAFAFENEPNGFRGVTWGTDIATVAGFKENGVYAQKLREYSQKGGQRFLTFPMVSYSKQDEKLEFGDVPIRSISYDFYKGKFTQATIYFLDGTYTGPGQAYSRMHEAGKAPPAGYNAKLFIDMALEKYFGKPTKSPGFFGAITGGSTVSYVGEVTEITSKCEGSERAYCSVTFESKELGKDVLSDWKGLIEQRVSEKLKSEELADKKRAEMKAKPDF